MTKYFESVYCKNSVDSTNMVVFGTDDKFSVHCEKINDWHVRRNGVRDSNLTRIMLNAAGDGCFTDHSIVTKVSDALRAQYESEKPKKFETDVSVIAIYGSVVPNARVFCEEYLEVEKLTNFIRDSFRQLPSNKKFRVTFEEIK